ncbi:MAG: lipoyl(octanoyl) transferase LipB [Alphaproteobacteria bacterium]|nr:lipoyl(octanoyl) transferase LipB [Alphaproteobacteria bacterium]
MPIWHNIKEPSKYTEVTILMEKFVEDIISEITTDTIILTEHENIITAGTNTKDEEIPTNLDVIRVGRGGKLTFHGVGQRIIYPIINLNNRPWNRDLKKYLKFLHDWIIATLFEFGIESHTRNDHPGIWVYDPNIKSDAKIAAIGIRVRKWVAYHGVSVNLHTNLDYYKNFIPCGIHNLGVTSAKACKKIIEFEIFDEALKKNYYTQLKKVKL